MKISCHRPLPLFLALVCLVGTTAVACDVEELVEQFTKGGGKKGSQASSSGQKGGSKATSNQDQAEAQGTESDGVVCDEGNEGVAWCADDSSILFCSAESWWLLDCGDVEAGAFCGYDEEANIVDCYVDDEGGEPGEPGEECSEIDEECADDADCCDGLICAEDGFCSEEESCLEFDEPCESDADCCSEECDVELALCN